MSANLIMGGKPHIAVSADPAAGAEASITVPEGATWLVVSATIVCAQGATQTPWPYLAVEDADGTQLVAFPGASDDMDASVTSSFTWAPGLPTTAAAALTVNTAPIPPTLLLKGGMKVETATDGIGANTNYGPLTLWVIAL